MSVRTALKKLHRERKRRMPRPVAELSRACWINCAGTKILRQCILLDVSDGGAVLSSSTLTPDNFELFLKLNDKVGHPCRVVSRSENKAIVEFFD